MSDLRTLGEQFRKLHKEKRIFVEPTLNKTYELKDSDEDEIALVKSQSDFMGFFRLIPGFDTVQLTDGLKLISVDSSYNSEWTRDLNVLQLNLNVTSLFPFELHSESLLSTVNFAAFHLRHQKHEFNNSTKIEHILEVCKIMQTIGEVTDRDTLNACILHNIFEGTRFNYESLQPFFKESVLDIVRELNCKYSEQKSDNSETFFQQLEKISDQAKAIKLAEIISNATALPKIWNENQKIEYLDWCDRIAETCKSSAPHSFAFFKRLKIQHF